MSRRRVVLGHRQGLGVSWRVNKKMKI